MLSGAQAIAPTAPEVCSLLTERDGIEVGRLGSLDFAGSIRPDSRILSEYSLFRTAPFLRSSSKHEMERLHPSRLLNQTHPYLLRAERPLLACAPRPLAPPLVAATSSSANRRSLKWPLASSTFDSTHRYKPPPPRARLAANPSRRYATLLAAAFSRRRSPSSPPGRCLPQSRIATARLS